MQYDFIIIGAGSAGSILAARLSEDADRSVLLIEAGPDYTSLETLPDDIKYGYATESGIISLSHDWGYQSQPTKTSKPEDVPRGKVTGGSSAVNAQIFLRGIPEDFEAWVAMGLDHWSYEQVLPYYKKLENDFDYDDEFHNNDGPIKVRRYPSDAWRPDQAAFYQACRDAGFPHCPDHNQPESTGVGPFPLNNIDGVRYSTNIGYLNPARHRPNLTIRANTTVEKLIIEGRQVTGVTVVTDGKTDTIRAKEVIISAGTFGSPQLLMLSGIGAANHLREQQIPVALDLPGVGQNLHDHPTVPLFWDFKPEAEIRKDSHWHQVGLRYTATNSDLTTDMIVYIGSIPKSRTLFIRPTVNMAFSKGQLTLKSNDPTEKPNLDFDYYADDRDQSRIREGVRICLDLVDHATFQPLIEKRTQPVDFDTNDDEALNRWIQVNATTGHHAAGTCKMGVSDDPLAVVNQFGLVHGLQGLRIVDASIMPESVRANINVTVMMLAERIADEIKKV
ncbi:MAG: mycofactocin system GMC family oxidoreductase MftG [Chloroflexota bacterium]